jgi:hypothetical protein
MSLNSEDVTISLLLHTFAKHRRNTDSAHLDQVLMLYPVFSILNLSKEADLKP